MKRGYYVLIAGGAIFIIGLVLTTVWALPLAAVIQQGTTILQGQQIGAGESVTARLDVSDTSKILSIVISTGTATQLNVVVLDPNGNQIFGGVFTEAMTNAVEPTVAGTYQLVVTNQSSSDSTVDAVFGYIPGVGEQDIDTGVYDGILTGVAVIIAGIMVMIGGVVVLILDRRK